MIIKVVGVTFKNEDTGEKRQDVLARVADEELKIVELQREPDNKYDPNAIKVVINGGQVGYIGKEIAAEIAPDMDAGTRYIANINELDIYKNRYYCTIMVKEA